MTILKVDPGILLFGVGINIPQRWVKILFGKRAVVIYGEGKGK